MECVVLSRVPGLLRMPKWGNEIDDSSDAHDRSHVNPACAMCPLKTGAFLDWKVYLREVV